MIRRLLAVLFPPRTSTMKRCIVCDAYQSGPTLFCSVGCRDFYRFTSPWSPRDS